MRFQFQTGNVTFFEEDQSYYEKTLFRLKKTLGNFSGAEDTVDARISIEKNKHKSGDRFEATATIHCPNNGKFHATTEAENIKKCADDLYSKLRQQIKKFHDKHIK